MTAQTGADAPGPDATLATSLFASGFILLLWSLFSPHRSRRGTRAHRAH
jgi:hypothetical protein